MRASILAKKLSGQKHYDKLIHKTKQTCLHSEPNYGVLWFYYKTSMIDNAVDVWQSAHQTISKEMESRIPVNWIGCQRLVSLMHNGMKIGIKDKSNKTCSFDEKMRVVYGFEQVLPQVSGKKLE